MKIKIRYFSIILLFLSGFSMPKDTWGKPPDYIGFIQVLRVYSTEFKLLFISLIFLTLFIYRKYIIKRLKTPPLLSVYLLFNLIIFFKYIFSDKLIFGFQQFITFSIVVFVFSSIYSIFDKHELLDIARYSGFLIISVNIIQIVVDFSSMFVMGRFISITGNAQHAAILFLGLIPIYYIDALKKSVVSIICLVLVLFFLFLTGSRTGLLGLSIFILLTGIRRVRYFIIIIIFILVITNLFPTELLQSFDIQLSSLESRVLNGENTRQIIWSDLFDAFLDNPFFGKDIEKNRVGYGESSILSAFANYGLIGGIPFLIILGIIIKAFRRNILKRDESQIVAAIIFSLFVASFFEAFLLSNISFSFYILLIYYFYLTKPTLELWQK